MKKTTILIFIAIVVILFPYFLSKSKRDNTVRYQVTKLPQAPMLFSELTIPYLRSKKYESRIGNLEKVFDKENYAGYLTSYYSEGLKINGLLTIPLGEKPSGGWPAVVFIHGYIPPAQYKTLERYSDHVDSLAKNGFVVFKIDLRGHGDSEGEPGGAYYSPDYVIDALNAHAALASADFVNPQKIGLWGHSMAGNIVLRSLAAKPGIRAAVIWAGAGYTYLDLREYRISDASYRPPVSSSQRTQYRQRLFEAHGSPSAQSTFWQQVSPASYLKDLKGALQINHAVDDDVVSIEYGRNLTKLLEEARVVHEFHEYQSGGHNITGSAFIQAMQNTVSFFKKYL